uniref:histone deacetylase n=1 Tax=Timema californicum TaxID=61474 RepID=A0A7R9JBS9_TIMCA|nr:unnamed protein product [Timema californicum]
MGAAVSSPDDVTTELFIAVMLVSCLYFQVKRGSSAGVEGHTSHFQKDRLKLKKQQQLQQQILLQHFQAQQQQLAEQHEQQLRQHLKEFWEHQKQLEEQRERREKERLEALKKKDKHEQSAVASTEVKQKLQGFLLSKKQREAAAAANGATITSQAFRSWSVLQGPQSVEPGSSGLTSGHPHPHPYRLQPIIATGHYESEDFPLRKTASEPNLLKVRLKQRVIERRSSPLARRKDRLLAGAKRKSQLASMHQTMKCTFLGVVVLQATYYTIV